MIQRTHSPRGSDYCGSSTTPNQTNPSRPCSAHFHHELKVQTADVQLFGCAGTHGSPRLCLRVWTRRKPTLATSAASRRSHGTTSYKPGVNVRTSAAEPENIQFLKNIQPNS